MYHREILRGSKYDDRGWTDSATIGDEKDVDDESDYREEFRPLSEESFY